MLERADPKARGFIITERVLRQQKEQTTVSVQSTAVPSKRKFRTTIAVPHENGINRSWYRRTTLQSPPTLQRPVV
jgi:hypothetical protein